MERDDLRVKCPTPGGMHGHKCEDGLLYVTDADLASLGLVQRPVCGECGGSGHRPGTSPTGPHEHDGWCRCPSCGGSGFGRLVALDGIDVEAVRRLREGWFDSPPTSGLTVDDASDLVLALIDVILAAIDQEDTP